MKICRRHDILDHVWSLLEPHITRKKRGMGWFGSRSDAIFRPTIVIEVMSG